MSEVNAKVLELIKMCIDSNSSHFSTFARYSGHIDQVQIDIHCCGWNAHDDPTECFYVKTTGEDGHISDRCERIMEKISELKEESDVIHSPENMAAQQAKVRANKVESLKRQLAALED